MDESTGDGRHVRQTEVVVDLGQRALNADNLDQLMNDACSAITELLNIEHCTIWEVSADREAAFLRSAPGWEDGPDASTTLAVNQDSHISQTLVTEGPVVVEDLRNDGRFPESEWPVKHDIVSGITVVIGPTDEPLGILGAHASEQQTFSHSDVMFLQGVANAMGTAIDRLEQGRQLQRQRDEWVHLIDTVKEYAIFRLDPDGRVASWNRGAERIKGYSKSEIISTHFSTFYPDDAVSDGLPDRLLAEARQTGSAEHEGWRIRKDGSRFWAQVTITALRDEGGEVVGFLKVIRDVPERLERARELKRFERAVEASGHAIFMTDPGGEITYVNPAFEELTGYSEDEVIGETPSVLQSGTHDDEFYESLWETVQSGEVWHGEIIDRRKNGEQYHAEQTIAPVTDESGSIDRFVAVQRDVTERKERERALRESHERLEEFASAVSHDLREPLNTVASYLQLLERRYEEQLDDDAEEFIEFAVSGATRMREMIDGLVTTYAQIESEGDPFEPVDLDDLLDDVLKDLEEKIEASDAEITAEPLPEIVGDRGQLRHLLLNLIDNGIKYSGDEPPEIQVAADNDGRMCEVAVIDYGIGMGPKATEKAFDVFSRAHSDEGYPGTGLGLAICDRIVERHGGEIWVESAPGEGSTFSFTLPTASNHDQLGE